jgi:hypothetical protein
MDSTQAPTPITPATSSAAGKPSVAVTVILIVSALGLWQAVFREMLLTAGQLSICEAHRLRLPWLTEQLFPFTRWFISYWWLTLVGLILWIPVVGLITLWVRHRWRVAVVNWLWAALLIMPPLLALEILWQSAFAVNKRLAHALRAQRDDFQNYLSPDGQQLQGPLKIREVRAGANGLGEEVLIIEPGGDWRVVPVREGVEGQPLRRGRLRAAQLVALAHYLAGQDFLGISEEETGPPRAANIDSLGIEFGSHRLNWLGVRRSTLRDLTPGAGWEWEWQVRFVALVLAIDDLVNQDHSPKPIQERVRDR